MHLTHAHLFNIPYRLHFQLSMVYLHVACSVNGIEIILGHVYSMHCDGVVELNWLSLVLHNTLAKWHMYANIWSTNTTLKLWQIWERMILRLPPWKKIAWDYSYLESIKQQGGARAGRKIQRPIQTVLGNRTNNVPSHPCPHQCWKLSNVLTAGLPNLHTPSWLVQTCIYMIHQWIFCAQNVERVFFSI